jgi:hypothetical protein
MAVGLKRIGFLVTVVFLGLWSAYSFWIAYTRRDWHAAVAAGVAAVACLGTARSMRGSRFLVYLLTLAFLGSWSYSVYDAVHAGYFQGFSNGEIAWSLLPESLLVVIACACSYAAFVNSRPSRLPV